MKLTARQQTVLQQLLSLAHELQSPIHYTDLAKKLGVSRFTAYDMLRVLEDKGFVETEYQTTETRSGPGRSTVHFSPTERAKQFFAVISYEDWDWETDFRQHLPHLSASNMTLLQELLDMLPEREQQPLVRYCGEVLAMSLWRLRHEGIWELAQRQFTKLWPREEPITAVHFSLLSGFILAMWWQSGVDDFIWEQELVAHLKQYQAVIMQMSAEDIRHLIGSFDAMRLLLGTAVS